MKRMQIKYCQTEEEANEFLKTLHLYEALDTRYPYLHAVQYLTKVDGSSSESCNAEGDSKVAFNVGNDFVIAIQYIINIEEIDNAK